MKRKFLCLFILFSYFILTAWGPKREKYNFQDVFFTPVLNSIKDNPKIGNESNFVRIREKDVGYYGDHITLEDGKTYTVYTLIHNNALSDSKYASKEELEQSIARGVRLYADLPSVLEFGQEKSIIGTVSSDNATPKKVWDEAYIKTSERKVSLKHVTNSTRVNSNGKVNSQTLPPSLFNNPGCFLGYDAFDGVLPGGPQYACIVIYDFKVTRLTIDVNIFGRVKGTKKWLNEIAPNAGEDVEIKIEFENISSVPIKSTSIKLSMPDGFDIKDLSPNFSTDYNSYDMQMSPSFLKEGVMLGGIPQDGKNIINLTLHTPKPEVLTKDVNTFMFGTTSRNSNNNEVEKDGLKIHVQRNKSLFYSIGQYLNKLDSSNIAGGLTVAAIGTISAFILKKIQNKIKNKK